MSFVRANVVRIYALAVAFFLLLAAYGIDLPQEAWLGLVAAILALIGGESAQRVENAKTEKAGILDPE